MPRLYLSGIGRAARICINLGDVSRAARKSSAEKTGSIMSSISRRNLLTGSGAALASTWVRPRPVRAADRPKNVLLLMSDQHRRSCLGAAGDPVAHTPNLDALAASGVRFNSGYCANPVCTPSRASLLTGLYTHHHQAWNNTVPWPFRHKTIAHY